MNRLKPDIVCFYWEGKGSAERRRKLLAEYKAGRKSSGFNRKMFTDPDVERAAIKSELIRLKKYVNSFPFYQFSIDYLEADDVIAYSCNKVFKSSNYEKIILSTDRDYYQLIDKHTKLLRPVKRNILANDILDGNIAIGKDLTKEATPVLNKKGDNLKTYGEIITYNYLVNYVKCYPQNYIIIKCFTGDADNIKGIPRVGEKTVLKDFPFLSSERKYEINDIVQYAKQESKINKRYEKYITEENIATLQQNQELIQLLEPNISLAAIDSIEKTFSVEPTFNAVTTRYLTVEDDLSQQKVDKWIDTFYDFDTSWQYGYSKNNNTFWRT